MARLIEVDGVTLDQAIFKGLEQLKLSIDEVELTILDEGKKGILGIGSKPARVRLVEREEPVVPEFLQEKDKPQEKQERPFRERNDRPRSTRPDRRDGGRRDDHQGVRRDDRSFDRRDNRRDGARFDDHREELPKGPYFPEGTEFVENEVTAFLRGLMEQMNIQGTVQAAMTENGLLVNLEGPNMGVLIGRRGETLDAIQYLTSLIYNKDKNEYQRVTVDTENYRKKREQTLIRLARKMAGQVAHTGRSASLEPMSPFERRIIHFALQNDRYVTTYSEGEEPNRRVIITKKENKPAESSAKTEES